MQDFEEIRKRFIDIYTHFGANKSKMGRICDVSHTAIGNIIDGSAKSFDVSILSNLNQNAPEIDLNWLITGAGNMLRTEKAGSIDSRIEDLEQANEGLQIELQTEKVKRKIVNDKLFSMQDKLIIALDELNKLKSAK